MNNGLQSYFLFLNLTLFTFPVFLLSQNLYKPGFILTNNRDTQYILIDFESHDLCKTKQKDLLTIYHPDQILGFGFPQDRYYSSQVIRDTFVEVLVTGRMSLYRFEKAYYIQKNNQPLVKIHKRPYRKRMSNNSMEIVEDTHWKGALKFLLSDCSGINDDFDQLNFSENALRNKIIEYNLCMKAEFEEYKAQLPLLALKPGLGLSITQSSLRFSDPELQSLPSEFRTIHAVPFVQVDFFTPKVLTKFWIHAEAHYNKFKALSETQRGSSNDRFYFESFHNINFLSFPVLLSYGFHKGRLRLALLAGIQNDLVISQKTRLITENLRNQTVHTELNPKAYVYGKRSTGFVCGISASKPLGRFSLSGNLRLNLQPTPVSGRLEQFLYNTYPFMNRYSLMFAISKR